MNDLFRPEALQSERNNLLGVVLLRQPVQYRVLSITLMIVFLSIVMLLVFGKYSKRVTATGHVSPSTGIIRLYPTNTGLVDQLNVTEGTIVQEGKVLARLNSQRNSTSAYDNETRLLDELKDSLLRIDHRIRLESELAKVELERMERKLTALEKSITNKRNQSVTAESKLGMEEKKLKNYQSLKKDSFLSDSEFQLQIEKYLLAKDSKEQLVTDLANLEAEFDDLKLRMRQEPSKLALQITSLENQRAELKQRIIEIESRRQQLILAPISGRVTAIQSSLGQMVKPSQTIMTIIPTNNEFIVELFVPTNSIGSIELGQKVYLRYQAFPYQRYGMYEGHVSEISSSIISRHDLDIGSILPNEPLYRVKVRLGQQEITSNEKRFTLSAGMLVDADIVQESRPIWKWLFEPIAGLVDRI